jgi:hypothetical protein
MNPSLETWRMGLHALHCREDRCGPNGERCDCPCHHGEVMPELTHLPEHDHEVRRGTTGRAGCPACLYTLLALDGPAIAAAFRALSDRISMLELDRKQEGQK